MTKLFVQFLAIYKNGIFPTKVYQISQSRFKILSNTRINTKELTERLLIFCHGEEIWSHCKQVLDDGQCDQILQFFGRFIWQNLEPYLGKLFMLLGTFSSM